MKKIILILLTVHASLFTLLPGEAQIIHVPADQPTIQAGINAASDGDTVLVADGTYLENINFQGKAITVTSNFLMDGDTNHINNTIINGSQPANPDYGSVVTFLTGEDTTSVICGFTITGGTGMPEPGYGARIGGGIVCYYASAKIIHNKITGNVVASASNAWGGGIISFRETGDYWTVITNNTIAGNQCIAETGTAEGGGLEIMGDARICDNVIVNNLCECSSGGSDGGGVYYISLNTPADTLFLINNQICNNIITTATSARGGGAAIFFPVCIIGQNTINYNSMTGNMTNGCGLLIRETPSANITGNVINHNTVNTDNIYWGVGCMFVEPAGQISIEDNEFSYNTGPMEVNTGVGGGLAIMDALYNYVSVTGNTFRNNTGNFGGGFYSRSCYVQHLMNNLFNGNEASSGGAIGIYIPAAPTSFPRPDFVNNTIVGNSASQQGGGAYINCETNIPVLFNDIFYHNSATEGNDIYFMGSSDPIVISYSDINQGNIGGPWIGEGNFNAAPGFIEGDTMYHLSLTSPCKNAGVELLEYDGTTYGAPLVDYDGEGRPDPQYHYFDAGADERWETPPAPLALDPDSIGSDNFIARWKTTLLALGYRLDVAVDENFSQMVPGYDNLDVGFDTTAVVSGLESLTYYYRVRAYNALWTSQNSNIIMVPGVGVETPLVQSSKFKVQSYPNPISDQSIIKFYLPGDCQVSFKVFDLTGREIETLVEGKLDKGEHTYIMHSGNLQSGVYLYRLTVGDEVAAGKMVVQR